LTSRLGTGFNIAQLKLSTENTRQSESVLYIGKSNVALPNPLTLARSFTFYFSRPNPENLAEKTNGCGAQLSEVTYLI
jgi:hypothetical protein